MKPFIKQLLGATALAFCVTSHPVHAQTALPPIPNSKVKQTKEHFEGDFGTLSRRKLQGGEIQRAWDDTATDGLEGIWNYERCKDCTYKVRLRDRMVTSIHLPKGERITGVENGDSDNFKVKVRNATTLAIKPEGFGGDTNLIVYGEDGRYYAFYLRAEGINSQNITDMAVNIKGEIPKEIHIPASDKPSSTPKAGDLAQAVSDLTPEGYEKSKKNDFIEHIPFNPDKLRGWGDYELWGNDELRPMTVFRDDHFTYVKFSEEQWAELELPTAYTVIDDIDELVNTHVKGTTYVIESTAKLISFKSGQKFLCIKYEG